MASPKRNNITPKYSDQESQAEISDDRSVEKVDLYFSSSLFKGKKVDSATQTYIADERRDDDDDDDDDDQPLFSVNGATADSNVFVGSLNIETDVDLFDFTGVNFKNFNFLLQKLNNDNQLIDDKLLSMKDKLFLFLVKIRIAMTFEAMSVVFSVNKTLASNVFYEILPKLATATTNLVYWPDKVSVKKMLPKCYSTTNTRVIMDSVKVRTRSPYQTVDDILNYKDTFTGKFLIGITPSGFISFKSKVVEGQTSDVNLAIESGILDLLEDGDVVLIEEELLELENLVNIKAGKKAVKFIVPPILVEKSNNEGDCELSKVRVHKIELMERLGEYQRARERERERESITKISATTTRSVVKLVVVVERH